MIEAFVYGMNLDGDADDFRSLGVHRFIALPQLGNTVLITRKGEIVGDDRWRVDDITHYPEEVPDEQTHKDKPPRPATIVITLTWLDKA